MSTLGFTLLTVTGGVVLVGAILALTFGLLRLARPADFDARPSARGLSLEQVVPSRVYAFRRESFEWGEPPNSAIAVYQGIGHGVELTAVQTGSEHEAVRVLGRFRRRGAIRATLAAKLTGNHSFLVQRIHGGRRIGWTNGEWAFIAASSDPAVLGEFVRSYPY